MSEHPITAVLRAIRARRADIARAYSSLVDEDKDLATAETVLERLSNPSGEEAGE